MNLRLFIISFFACVQLFGQYRSPFNQQSIESDSTGNYSFIVSGHFYGDGTNKSHFPANTLLANLDWINNSNADMLVCLGDLFKDISNEIPNYQTSFFDKLNIPLVNSVGNHDLTGTIYQDNFGETSFSFTVNNDIHLILDSERDNGDYINEQLELLKSVKTKVNQGGINNVFIYTHRTIWKDAYPEMEDLFLDNTQALTQTNYQSTILPILNEIGKKANVYIFSGSLGTAPASFFYFDDTKNNIKIIATAIRTLPRDAMLKVNINAGKVSFETKSLTGQELLPLEQYNIDYWETTSSQEPFNWKILPYYGELIITHRYFWYGILSSITLFGLYFLFKNKSKKRKS